MFVKRDLLFQDTNGSTVLKPMYLEILCMKGIPFRKKISIYNVMYWLNSILFSEVVLYKSLFTNFNYLILRVSTLNINKSTFQLNGHITKKSKK